MESVQVFASEETLAEGVARFVAEKLQSRIARNGKASLVLAGGKTPGPVYRRLASEEISRIVNWGAVHLFWGDERCVPPEHADSNFRKAREELIESIPLPVENIHRIPGERPPEEGAAAYEREIRACFAESQAELPVFDLILLGVGADGHVASLFPGLEPEAGRLAVPVFRADHNRVSITMPVINNGEDVLMLVSGPSKSEIVRDIFNKGESRLPAQDVRPLSGNLHWFIDEAAASLLPERSRR